MKKRLSKKSILHEHSVYTYMCACICISCSSCLCITCSCNNCNLINLLQGSASSSNHSNTGATTHNNLSGSNLDETVWRGIISA
jgi:hypothetical protein